MNSPSDNIPIDPCLLQAPSLIPNNPSAGKDLTLTLTHTPSSARNLAPVRDTHGNLVVTSDEYWNTLLKVKPKAPLQEECISLGLKIAKKANLTVLRKAIAAHWFPDFEQPTPPETHVNDLPSRPPPSTASFPASNISASSILSTACPTHVSESTSITPNEADTVAAEETALVQEFDIEGADAQDILGFDDEEDEEDIGDEDDDTSDEIPPQISSSPLKFQAYQTSIRVAATKRAEQNRRPGGRKTQQAMVRAWKEFTTAALENGSIKDDIVDEHSLLLFISFSAERPKKNRRGINIPGTFIGAAQLKKLFFGALRIRKEQDARDSTLLSRRRATSVVVWDAIKNRMNEALERMRNGLVPEEDAPDIVANTFLAEVTQDELNRVGKAFLSHRELRCAINGHLVWTTQHATGNRGDDIRSLRLSELQPWNFLHPNNETSIFTVLGLQGEEKTGKRGMKTTVNPVYSSFIAHLRPEMCPLGALAFLQHYLYDVKDLASLENIDWSLNKSWRQIRLLHSSKSMTTCYSEQSLYGLFVKAFARAGFDSRLKAHLARHILGYKQEALGVDSRETSKLGWKRGETYSDTYSPSIPKTAVLACHGYKEHENYDPAWRHVRVPESFLQLVCPMAEEILEEVKGQRNLRGTTGYWEMVIILRPYLFQCGAAIYKFCPESTIFKLPAFTHPDVRNWMTTTFLADLSILEANSGSPVDLQRIQNQSLQMALEEMRCLQSRQAMEMKKLISMVERRTSALSPTKGFSMDLYHHQTESLSLPLLQPAVNISAGTSLTLQEPSSDEIGIYEAPDLTFRAFVNDSPKTPNLSRSKTQVDLVLPPIEAFCSKNPVQPRLLWPPVLGQQGANWTSIFKLIKQPHELWSKWKPSKTLDQYGSIQAVWDLFHQGEAEYSQDGIKTGMKPPLRLIEQYFGSRWRPGNSARKTWERFREIPDWIDLLSAERDVSPGIVIEELEDMRRENEGVSRKGLNSLVKDIKLMRVQRKGNPSNIVALPISLDDPPSFNLELQTGGKKRRAKPLDPRKRPKLQKTS